MSRPPHFSGTCEEELKTLFFEAKWVLLEELPRVGAILQHKLQEVVRLLQNESDLVSFATKTEELPGRVLQQGARLKGNIKLEGIQVSSGELICILRNAYGKKVVDYSTSISAKPGIPLVPDIQYCFNYLKTSLTTLSALLERNEEISEIIKKATDFSPDTVKLQQQVLKDIRIAIEGISTHLSKAKHELQSSTPPSFPLLISDFAKAQSQHERDFSFQPRPPSDLLVQITVANVQIKISVYLLQVVPTRPRTVRGHGTMEGHSYKLNNNQWVQVTDHLDAYASVYFLQEVEEIISSSLSLCSCLRDKLICVD